MAIKAAKLIAKIIAIAIGVCGGYLVGDWTVALGINLIVIMHLIIKAANDYKSKFSSKD